LAHKYKIVSVPTFLLFNNAAEVWRQAGLMTKEALVEQIH
jgi:thioredoxin-related protein